MTRPTEKRRLRTLLLAVLAVSCLTAAALAADYPDVKNHWARSAIEKWSDTGILQGYPDGGFHPNDPVTRGQLATVLYRILGAEPVAGYTYDDLPESAWCHDSVTTMNYYGIALNTDLSIRPDEALKREEAFFMIAKAFQRGELAETRASYYKKTPTDFAQVSDQYTSAISTMLRLGFVQGSGGKLLPQSGITRAEVITIIDNMFDLYVSQPGTYHLTYGESALVTCSDVTLLLDQVSKGESSTVYLTAGADRGIVLANDGGGTTASVSIFATAKQTPAWTLRGDIKESQTATRVLTEGTAADLRFAAGFGKKSQPYMIATAEQFRLLTGYTDSLDSHVYFKLGADIALPDGCAPLGSADGAFIRANLDGGGHTVIYQLTSDSYGQAGGGLFYGWNGQCSALTVGGTVDLTLSEAAASAGDLYFGGFAAYAGRALEGCTADMDIHIRYTGGRDVTLHVGGLVGHAEPAELRGCTASGSVRATLPRGKGSAYVGGLVGSSAATPFGSIVPVGELSDCGAAGTVAASGGDHTVVGGIVGMLTYRGTEAPAGSLSGEGVVRCWSTAAVSASGSTFQSDCGGIVGQLNFGKLAASWAAPTVSAESEGFPNVGGIAGACYEAGTISDCWVSAKALAVGGGLRTGGIAGRLRGGSILGCCVPDGSVLGSGNTIASASCNEGTVSGCGDASVLSQPQREALEKAHIS